MGSATATVQVVPPSFGLRAGVVVSGRDVTFGRVPRLGLRLTPTVDVRPRPAQRQSADELERAASNPLSYLTNLFSSLLSDGLFTIEIDIEPNEAMLFDPRRHTRTRGAFSAPASVLRRRSETAVRKGSSLRLTVGTQLDLFGTDTPFPLKSTLTSSFRRAKR